ncbi:fused response regulator/phosphatase [Atopomonas sediminilitoris]|uniref:fused response regulator/phosphatase n=1 Tax=Atopomonas sediminilitoris TaxID=2919919 RepID=UPI001F4EFF12|nr:fused response regulator/phosphatase [Atopomonas sediminilitoris]MCJ8167946.1 fused response regulator/phosphatase [Atopomonas sediminilitoris]
MSEPCTVLIAEDNAADRLLLSTIVSKQGHRAIVAANGAEAVELFAQERPQLVLMDALMPVMDGFDATRQIKALAGDELVPVIFLTSLTETEALVRALDAGGDDFLSKPYNKVILQAKLGAMLRMRSLHSTVLEQRNLIAKHNEHLLSEQRVAKAVFDRIAHAGCLSAANIRYLQSPFALFNGDLLLAAFTPSGGMNILLGDFTGHGLPAAVGAMPLSEVFYGMTAKGFSIADVLREMNQKLKRILPVGVFCCATLIHLNLHQRVLEVWNGGLPAGVLCRKDGSQQPLLSRNLPLGILEPESFNDHCEVFDIAEGDRILLWSDGVPESGNAAGEMFGEERLLNVLKNAPHEHLFDQLRAALSNFTGEQQDDLSLVEVAVVPEESLPWQSLPASASTRQSPLDWSAGFDFRASTLQAFNPLPFLMQWLLEVQELRPLAGTLYTMLTEVYSNALEHGVLGLDSALKADANGFAAYYRERMERLEALEQGWVRLHFDHRMEAEGGCLTIQVSDSGGGLPAAAMAVANAGTPFAGRGLRLLNELADECWRDEADGSLFLRVRWQR